MFPENGSPPSYLYTVGQIDIVNDTEGTVSMKPAGKYTPNNFQVIQFIYIKCGASYVCNPRKADCTDPTGLLLNTQNCSIKTSCHGTTCIL